MVEDAQAEPEEAIVVDKAIREAIELLQRCNETQHTEVNHTHLLLNADVICHLTAMKITKNY